jgi:hypothetical protein
LVIVLDSICYDMVEQAYLSGRFRLFTPPCRTVPPFPVMTDLCLAELFDCSPSTAVETEYYDGQKLVDGWSTYGREANSRWLEGVDVFSPYSSHAHIYTHADRGYDEELRQIETAFLHDRGADLVTYVVASSALGAANGRNGHASGLVRLDRFCQSLIHRCRGRVNITLLSDHGHYFTLAKYVDLDVELRRLGYRVTQRLSGPTDVVVPAFGMVTYAGLYTRSPSRVARDLLGIEGVEITSMRDADGDVHVFSRDGAARIRRREGKFRYHCDYGDPLQLKPIFSGLNENGRVDADGFVDDRTLFEAAHNHLYPDAIARLYRAFNGLVEHTPDVLVSFSEGRFWGSPFMSAIYDLHGSHGNLNLPGSSGFVMTTAGALPKVMRIAEVSEALKGIGAPIRSRKQAGTATPAKRK